jgi:3-hydroxyisobutyrate dehydrogenase-like beta-hydroxyacid dehydrogenase
VMGRVNTDFSGQLAEKATLLKAIGNTFVLSKIETISEAYVVAEKTRLGVDALLHFLEMMSPGPYVAYLTRMKSGDYYKREEPLSAVDLASASNRPASQALISDLVGHGRPERPGYTSAGIGNCL